jgi:XTP/dITP diphosphohydrolase
MHWTLGSLRHLRQAFFGCRACRDTGFGFFCSQAESTPAPAPVLAAYIKDYSKEWNKMDKANILVYVTSNEVKFKVAQQALQNSRITLERKSLNTPEIQSRHVEEIAEWSAIWSSQQLNQPVVVMDAGYYIEVLNGFPGPFIKFVNEWLSADDYLNLLKGKTNRRVIIRDCLAYCRPNEKPTVFCQLHHGEVATKAGKQNGTSIDQIFIPEGYSKPISEIPSDEILTYWSNATIWQDLKLHIECLGNGD